MIKLGKVILGAVPRVAVPLSDIEIREKAGTARSLADIFELRIDQFGQCDPGYVRRVCEDARRCDMPLIATVRAEREGGQAHLTEDRRLAIFTALADVVDALDIEIQAPIRDSVIALGHRSGKVIIASVHNFDATPPDEELERSIEAGEQAGADIVKLAVTATTGDDTRRLLDLLRRHRDRRIIVIAMGMHGAMSRVFFPLVGSLITYGFLREANAPGQLSLDDLTAELRRYCPDFRR